MDEKEMKESTQPFSAYEYIYPGEIEHVLELDECKRSRKLSSEEDDPITLYVSHNHCIYDVYGGEGEEEETLYYCVPRKVNVDWYGIRSSRGIHRLYSPIGDLTKVILDDAIATYKRDPDHVVVTRGRLNTTSTERTEKGRVATVMVVEKKELVPLSWKDVFPSTTDSPPPSAIPT
jgi:hypothetical protein